MTLQDTLDEIDELYQTLKTLKPLNEEYEERLWQKFRLEWNYNSNHIEGNTLTYGQTYLLIIKGDVTGDHKIQEIDEMRAHDLVVLKLREYAKDISRELTEADIREWNKIILVRPYWKEAITATGQPTRKLITPGNYKQTPNSVRLENGEIFYYATPEDTPVLMKELVEWYRHQTIRSDLHPVQIAAMLHYKFVRIHPFDDSNGRTARLLMNYELLRKDFPPVIIKSQDKRNYILALSKADAGDIDAFVEYIAIQLKWSLNLTIKAASGENIEEPDDILKEISLWKRQESSKEILKNWKTTEHVKTLYETCIRNLLLEFVEKHKVLMDQFQTALISVSIQEGNHRGSSPKHSLDYNWIKLVDRSYSHEYLSRRQHKGFEQIDDKIVIEITFKTLLRNPVKNQAIKASLHIDFKPSNYTVKTKGGISLQRNYNELITPLELNRITSTALKASFEELKLLSKKN